MKVNLLALTGVLLLVQLLAVGNAFADRVLERAEILGFLEQVTN